MRVEYESMKKTRMTGSVLCSSGSLKLHLASPYVILRQVLTKYRLSSFLKGKNRRPSYRYVPSLGNRLDKSADGKQTRCREMVVGAGVLLAWNPDQSRV